MIGGPWSQQVEVSLAVTSPKKPFVTSPIVTDNSVQLFCAAWLAAASRAHGQVMQMTDARDLALILAHEHLLRPGMGNFLEMSREYRHIYIPSIRHRTESRPRSNGRGGPRLSACVDRAGELDASNRMTLPHFFPQPLNGVLWSGSAGIAEIDSRSLLGTIDDCRLLWRFDSLMYSLEMFGNTGTAMK
ncbi:hypothetical protein [Oricola nitratireducens]|uniref:hypothetical protein n=1 Tax=Oricola nitratireducens TaxID=2775868 RepID=UPI00186959E8|nr:hypothetical protein [Oricola nitratireducens]